MQPSPPRSYRDLTVWRRSRALAVACYRVSDAFPAAERFGLTQQLRRAAVSVASNIAEGSNSRYPAVYLRHLDIAHGSLAELATQLELADELGWIADGQFAALDRDIGEVGRMLGGLWAAVKRRIPP